MMTGTPSTSKQTLCLSLVPIRVPLPPARIIVTNGLLIIAWTRAPARSLRHDRGISKATLSGGGDTVIRVKSQPMKHACPKDALRMPQGCPKGLRQSFPGASPDHHQGNTLAAESMLAQRHRAWR